jgi:hypothetical protein
MTGPIFSLRLFGLFCPCFENSEDKSARVSLQQLNTVGARVDWHVGNIKRTGMNNPAGFVRGLFSRQQQQPQPQHTDTQPPTPSQLKLVDSTKDSINNGAPYAELQIQPLPKSQLEEGGDGSEKPAGGVLKRQTMNFTLDIPLHHIHRIENVDPTMIVIVTKDIHSTDDKKSEKEAARISFTSQDDRDAVALDIKVLVEWCKQRQPDIEDDLPAEGIKARAVKAAHFAKREIEMRDTKRTREQRKAKYVQESGGLKYTAMAMANRVDS